MGHRVFSSVVTATQTRSEQTHIHSYKHWSTESHYTHTHTHTQTEVHRVSGKETWAHVKCLPHITWLLVPNDVATNLINILSVDVFVIAQGNARCYSTSPSPSHSAPSIPRPLSLFALPCFFRHTHTHTHMHGYGLHFAVSQKLLISVLPLFPLLFQFQSVCAPCNYLSHQLNGINIKINLNANIKWIAI